MAPDGGQQLPSATTAVPTPAVVSVPAGSLARSVVSVGIGPGMASYSGMGGGARNSGMGGGMNGGMGGMMGDSSVGTEEIPYDMTAVGGLHRVAINVGYFFEGMIGVNADTVERLLRPFQGMASVAGRCADRVGRSLVSVTPRGRGS